MSAKLKALQELIEPAVVALGLDLWGLDFHSAGRQSTLRIYIDGPEGVSVDDCARVSHQVSGILDVEDPIQEQYMLEVSSPGMDRPLFTLEHFKAYAGHTVQLRLRVPFEGRRKFKGLLNGVEGDEVLLVVDDEEYLLPVDYIDRANVIPQF
ncbi:MAG: ribosome maturation factor RimP [Oceanospirillales bacterium]|uniref:Ribosome maturation factor RimP n=1 Tax=Marinobacterium halophilum TaxID=267374 RepID=A0A2P8EM14_9GAMM|nr:ribosome maturation factor RimP [Marinobacterium halophilum]MBR9828968.1 ribosome maturation factor RimP [Oceanospirillales bacterium]PSL10523.1 ribosome maturation factor RimP [Marinobacterium halophilum]